MTENTNWVINQKSAAISVTDGLRVARPRFIHFSYINVCVVWSNKCHWKSTPNSVNDSSMHMTILVHTESMLTVLFNLCAIFSISLPFWRIMNKKGTCCKWISALVPGLKRKYRTHSYANSSVFPVQVVMYARFDFEKETNQQPPPNIKKYWATFPTYWLYLSFWSNSAKYYWIIISKYIDLPALPFCFTTWRRRRVHIEIIKWYIF